VRSTLQPSHCLQEASRSQSPRSLLCAFTYSNVSVSNVDDEELGGAHLGDTVLPLCWRELRPRDSELAGNVESNDLRRSHDCERVLGGEAKGVSRDVLR
jgi:hypothetical protein